MDRVSDGPTFNYKTKVKVFLYYTLHISSGSQVFIRLQENTDVYQRYPHGESVSHSFTEYNLILLLISTFL